MPDSSPRAIENVESSPRAQGVIGIFLFILYRFGLFVSRRNIGIPIVDQGKRECLYSLPVRHILLPHRCKAWKVKTLESRARARVIG